MSNSKSGPAPDGNGSGPPLNAAVMQPAAALQVPSEQPRLHMGTLRALAEELGDAAHVLRFLSTYLSMLPMRMGRIDVGLAAAEAEPSLEAVLSLKISSSMVGARVTERHCRAMEKMIRKDRLSDAIQALPALRRVTDQCYAARPHLLDRAAEALLRRGGP
ncbi:Hpt domain-containing protein [Paenarthrobacter ureafaciens]|uniref:Hpt domain-containing protein n=1 Tax=Paenarthrobacter ureafaciens TaxID=37931 RepID=UPI001FB50699|nr:Hpt domain-containing protein [Paenarthrobacter ureafaciens]UOD81105.1 Hpt domain-containing protein [Paenarthrobacter ureafaciens]WNZ03764.1 Hpt domain-containing protein [Paenarthrobacter ureafaciens]